MVRIGPASVRRKEVGAAVGTPTDEAVQAKAEAAEISAPPSATAAVTFGDVWRCEDEVSVVDEAASGVHSGVLQ